jgi:pimeloyl-ACP methyl ester carboxylesterase
MNPGWELLMRITLHPVLWGLLSVLVSSVAVPAQTTLVVGEKVAADSRGIAIYHVPVNHVQLGYKLQGEGETLVLINGLGATMSQWSPALLDALARHYQLLLLDNRGMGYSSVDAASFDASLFADDVLGLLDVLHIRKAHVMASGFGGMVVQALLVSHPERVDKAVLIGAPVDGADAGGKMKGYFVPNPVALRQLQALTQWKAPLDRLAQVKNPVLLVAGTNDRVISAGSSKTLASTIPGAWLVQFRNGGYNLTREAPVALAQAILAFLQTSTTVPLKDTR